VPSLSKSGPAETVRRLAPHPRHRPRPAARRL